MPSSAHVSARVTGEMSCGNMSYDTLPTGSPRRLGKPYRSPGFNLAETVPLPFTGVSLFDRITQPDVSCCSSIRKVPCMGVDFLYQAERKVGAKWKVLTDATGNREFFFWARVGISGCGICSAATSIRILA